MVSLAGPSIWGVLRNMKWFRAPAVPLAMLWQSVHRIAPPTVVDWCTAWRPENGLLFSGFPADAPTWWHCRHPASVFPSMDPVRQFGAVTAPWQLTLAQVRAALSNAA